MLSLVCDFGFAVWVLDFLGSCFMVFACRFVFVCDLLVMLVAGLFWLACC